MAWLWFFFIGLTMYLSPLPFRNKTGRIRFWMFVGSGMAAAVPAAFLGAPGVAAFHVPAGLIIVEGMLAGLVIFWTERNRWFEKFWLRFFVTPILGMLLACILFCIFAVYSALHETMHVIRLKPLLVFFTFFLMGLLTAFGYTFPERWFAKKGK